MKPLTKSFLIFFFLFSVFCFLSSVSYADIPKTINFQGRLTDRDGKPLEGSQPIVISLYDAPTAGNRLWSETQTVSIFNGVFDCVLGSAAPFPSNLDFNKQYYLEFSVAGQTLLPRQKLSSTPYSLNSERLAGLTANDFLRADSKGNVGIGTTTPTEKLHVLGTAKASSGFATDFTEEKVSRFTFSTAGLNRKRDIRISTDGETEISRIEVSVIGAWYYSGKAGALTKHYDINYNRTTGTFYEKFQYYTETEGNTAVNMRIGDIVYNSSDKTLRIPIVHLPAVSAGANELIMVNVKINRVIGSHSFLGMSDEYTDSVIEAAPAVAFGGNVGIGTTRPTQRLDVDGSIALPPGYSYRWEDTDGTYRGAIRAHDTSYDLEFYTQAAGGGPRVTIQNDGDLIVNTGNVGIGTPNPSERLHIDGKVKAKEFITGDITFTNKQTGVPLWTMFEDENGLYLKSATTGKEYKFVLEEIKR